eukprot:TRINITY_DN1814_c0_g1_i1.p1 TRINITY_DN1814_c0_g1~~TRINITY_DN1814_c0_g1_i1.p1  ORF type:complete len:151 (+),score=24.29 TRINITY_DN1814_c0_g1_i1:768-1220(+)
MQSTESPSTQSPSMNTSTVGGSHSRLVVRMKARNTHGCSSHLSRKRIILTSGLLAQDQTAVAKLLGVPSTLFQERWEESMGDRKWPHKRYLKIEREKSRVSMGFIEFDKKHNNNQSVTFGSKMHQDLIKGRLSELCEQQKEMLRPATIIL